MTSIVLIIILFLIGFIFPSTAKPLQRWFHRKFRHMERKTDKAPGISTSILKAPIKATRKSAVKSLAIGRKARDKAPF